MAIAVGSFSVVDMYDSRALQSFISSNLSKYQVYNPDSGQFSPSWATTNLVLEAEVYIAGTSTDISATSDISSIRWYQDDSTTPITSSGAYAISGTNGRILTINQNILESLSTVTFRCEVKFLDPVTNLTVTTISDISFVKVASGGGIVDALAETPQGNAFKNNLISSLTGTCFLWRGSTQNTTNVSYQWYAQDSTVTTDQGGGRGWKKLTNTTNMYTGVTTSTITIYPNAVTNVQTFKCIIKDGDSTSPSYNQSFEDYITVLDMQDPYSVVIESTGGSVFKDGIGSTRLIARLFQSANEVDPYDGTGTKAANAYDYTYKWYKYDNDSILDPDFGGTGVSYQTGKYIDIGSNDVTIKATFKVEVE